MFTGLVESTGRIKSISRRNNACRLEILTKQKLDDVKVGDSVSVNGACLSVVGIKGKALSFDIMAETLKNTSFPQLKNNDVINIERSLRADARIDGHFVLGHVDSVQKIREIKKQGKPHIDVTIAKNDRAYIIKKGSIAIDGVSFTIGEIHDDKIRAYIIPHTLRNTSLKLKKKGDVVNLEFDVLGKYALNRSLGKKGKPISITEEFLKIKGFI